MILPIARANSVENPESSSMKGERLQVVAEDSVTRLVAEVLLIAGGSAAALVVGEALGRRSPPALPSGVPSRMTKNSRRSSHN